ncbi:MAG TPA: O-methyltransferase [Negativicutes bacterium]|jgi:predicted O-methyltransferase YrrM
MNNVLGLLQEMEMYAAKHHIPIIMPAGGKILSGVVAKLQPQSILEIGTAIGYSTLLMATKMVAGAKIVTIEQDQERVDIAKDFLARSDMLGRIDIICGDAGKVLPQLTESFDMVFIDAAKGQYLDYLHKVMDKLVPGAVIIADNVLFRGMVMGGDIPRRYRTLVRRLREYLEFVSHHPHLRTTIHSEGDGMAISYYQST